MSESPNVFIKNSLIRDLLVKKDKAQSFKDGISSLMSMGAVVAIGEEAIERTFITASEFEMWFEGADSAPGESMTSI